MSAIPWPKKLGTRIGVIAVALLIPTLLVVAESLWVITAWRNDTQSVIWMGRGRKLASDYSHLAHRLVDGEARNAELKAELKRVMGNVEERHAKLAQQRGRPALSRAGSCDGELVAQSARWREVTRPALEALLRAPAGEAANNGLLLAERNAARESNELLACIDATHEAASSRLRRLQFLHGGFLVVVIASALTLVWLARRISLRIRELCELTERVGSGDMRSFTPLPGEDEIASVGASFSSTVSRIRAYFESEHHSLQQRLEAVTNMNAQLAAGGSGLMSAVVDSSAALHSANGLIGSIPPAAMSVRTEHIATAQRRSLRAGSPGGAMRLLLVDDDPEVLRGFDRVLTSKGYTVITAKSAKDALKALSKDSFDVVISDITMPDMSGIQLLREVRGRDLLVPVVLITGSPEVRTAAEAVEFGAFQYLVKPVQKDSLLRVVEHAGRVHEVARTRQEVSTLLGQDSMAADRAGLEATFERTLQSLWMAYQPIVDVRSQRIFGYEALMRSNEPGLPHPGAVLDAAERLGRLPTLGQTVRARAAEPMLTMADGPLLFVNLHVRDLVDPMLSDPASPLSQIARRVVLEITERVSLDEVRDARLRVAQLREMGFRIAVDDMGAGYAGLSSFAVLEPEIVKLDMSLVRDVHLSPVRQKVIRSMASLSLDMGIEVIAEGVETQAEREMLEALGCTLLQGYLFAKPGRPFPLVAW